MQPMTRRSFIHDVIATSSCLAVSGFSLCEPASKISVTDFFARNLIIDGVILPRSDFWPAKGEVKRLTGIDVAMVSATIDRLPNYRTFCERSGSGYHLVQTIKDFARAKKARKCGLIIYVQHSFQLNGNLDLLLEWKQQGLRVLQFTYEQRNELGGGSRNDQEPLSRFGRAVLKSCNTNGILVDVSHCGKQTTLDIAHASTKPVTANHANAEALCTHRRNKSLEEINAIVDTGGVIGVTIIGRFLQQRDEQSASIGDFLNHIDYIVDKVGIDHVGVGSDSYWDGSQVFPEYDNTDSYLNSYERWYYVAERLMQRGYKESDLTKIFGGNFLRVFKAVFDSE